MDVLIIVLIVIVSLLIGIVVLVQNPKGGGLAEGFQGAASVGGVKKTTDFLEKSTWYLTVVLFVLCLASTAFFNTSGGEGEVERNTDDIEQSIDAGDGELPVGDDSAAE